MIKIVIAATLLVILAACQSTPGLEDDTRYVRLATVVDIHEYTEIERKQAKANQPSDTRVGFGFGIGSGSYGSFSGMSLGIGTTMGERRSKQPPQIADGANRYTVQPLGSTTRIEIMSYEPHQAGDCVKVLVDHPTEYPRFFALKPDEHCE
jgi:hypothetical protein